MVNYLPRQAKEKGQLELIHFIHSLFSFGDNETRLPLYASELLAPSGTLQFALEEMITFGVKLMTDSLID